MTNQENGVDLKSAAVTEEKKLFIETYGCQMNVADSEVVASIMKMDGYAVTDKIEDADAIFVNTCSVRDNAEQKIYGRLQYFQSLKRKKKSLVIGVLGCMAERVKEELIEVHHADLVVGPDSYMDLPNLVGAVEHGEKASLSTSRSSPVKTATSWPPASTRSSASISPRRERSPSAIRWQAATAIRASCPAFCRRRICPSCPTALRSISF